MRIARALSLGLAALPFLQCGGAEKSDISQPDGAGSPSNAATAGRSGAASSGGGPSASGGRTSGGTASTHAGVAGTGSATAASGGASGTAGAPPAVAHCADNLIGLEVDSGGARDPLGYPPYALDECRLVYLARDADAGALLLRAASAAEDELLEPAATRPRRPTLAGDVIAWEIEEDGRSQIRVRYGGVTTTLRGPFHHAAEPRASADAVVFTAFMAEEITSDADVFLYDPLRDTLAPVITGDGQQRFADVSATHVAASDFSEGPRGYFDESSALADIVVMDRRTGAVSRRERPGKQAFPLLGSDGRLVYLEWGDVHPEPKFSQFWLNFARLDAPASLDGRVLEKAVQTSRAYVRPSVRGDRVDFLDTVDGAIGLYSARITSSSPAVHLTALSATSPYGPIATDGWTLTSEELQADRLRLVFLQRFNE